MAIGFYNSLYCRRNRDFYFR